MERFSFSSAGDAAVEEKLSPAELFAKYKESAEDKEERKEDRRAERDRKKGRRAAAARISKDLREGKELNQDQHILLLKDLADGSDDVLEHSVLADTIAKNYGFASLNDALIKHRVKGTHEVDLEREGQKINFRVSREKPQNFQEAWQQAPRIVKEGIKLGATLGGITLGALFFPPAALGIAGAYGAAAGSFGARNLTSYFARDKRIFGKKEGEKSAADNSLEQILLAIYTAREEAKNVRDKIEDPEAELTQAEKTEELKNIASAIQKKELEDVQKFHGLSLQADLLEAGAGMVGGVAGGAVGAVIGAKVGSHSAVATAFEEAKKHGFKLRDHFVKIIHGAWHNQVGQADLDPAVKKLGAHGAEKFLHVISEQQHDPVKGIGLTQELLDKAGNNPLFHSKDLLVDPAEIQRYAQTVGDGVYSAMWTQGWKNAGLVTAALGVYDFAKAGVNKLNENKNTQEGQSRLSALKHAREVHNKPGIAPTPTTEKASDVVDPKFVFAEEWKVLPEGWIKPDGVEVDIEKDLATGEMRGRIRPPVDSKISDISPVPSSDPKPPVKPKDDVPLLGSKPPETPPVPPATAPDPKPRTPEPLDPRGDSLDRHDILGGFTHTNKEDPGRSYESYESIDDSGVSTAIRYKEGPVDPEISNKLHKEVEALSFEDRQKANDLVGEWRDEVPSENRVIMALPAKALLEDNAEENIKSLLDRFKDHQLKLVLKYDDQSEEKAAVLNPAFVKAKELLSSNLAEKGGHVLTLSQDKGDIGDVLTKFYAAGIGKDKGSMFIDFVPSQPEVDNFDKPKAAFTTQERVFNGEKVTTFYPANGEIEPEVIDHAKEDLQKLKEQMDSEGLDASAVEELIVKEDGTPAWSPDEAMREVHYFAEVTPEALNNLSEKLEMYDDKASFPAKVVLGSRALEQMKAGDTVANDVAKERLLNLLEKAGGSYLELSDSRYDAGALLENMMAAGIGKETGTIYYKHEKLEKADPTVRTTSDDPEALNQEQLDKRFAAASAENEVDDLLENFKEGDGKKVVVAASNDNSLIAIKRVLAELPDDAHVKIVTPYADWWEAQALLEERVNALKKSDSRIEEVVYSKDFGTAKKYLQDKQEVLQEKEIAYEQADLQLSKEDKSSIEKSTSQWAKPDSKKMLVVVWGTDYASLLEKLETYKDGNTECNILFERTGDRFALREVEQQLKDNPIVNSINFISDTDDAYPYVEYMLNRTTIKSMDIKPYVSGNSDVIKISLPPSVPEDSESLLQEDTVIHSLIDDYEAAHGNRESIEKIENMMWNWPDAHAENHYLIYTPHNDYARVSAEIEKVVASNPNAVFKIIGDRQPEGLPEEALSAFKDLQGSEYGNRILENTDVTPWPNYHNFISSAYAWGRPKSILGSTYLYIKTEPHTEPVQPAPTVDPSPEIVADSPEGPKVLEESFMVDPKMDRPSQVLGFLQEMAQNNQVLSWNEHLYTAADLAKVLDKLLTILDENADNLGRKYAAEEIDALPEAKYDKKDQEEADLDDDLFKMALLYPEWQELPETHGFREAVQGMLERLFAPTSRLRPILTSEDIALLQELMLG